MVTDFVSGSSPASNSTIGTSTFELMMFVHQLVITRQFIFKKNPHGERVTDLRRGIDDRFEAKGIHPGSCPVMAAGLFLETLRHFQQANDFGFDILSVIRHSHGAFMKKYLALAVLPILASCTSTPASTKLADIPERPSQDASQYSERHLNKGLSYPMGAVDQASTSSIDITEDSADLVTGVGTRQVRDGSNIVVRSTRRGARVVRKEGTRIAETVYDVGDQVAELGHDELIDNSGFVMNGYERVTYAGGTVVCGAMTTYSNVWDSATRGLFGGLLRCTVRDTKPYMVGSLNDSIRDNTMPGAGWRKAMPDLSGYAPQAATSGKGVYTSSK